jgi:hypothetical protein
MLFWTSPENVNSWNEKKKKSTSKDDNSIVYLVYHSIVMIDRRWMKRENYPVLENVQHMTGRAIVGV